MSWVNFRYTGEVIAGQGEMGTMLDTPTIGLLSSPLRMSGQFSATPRFFWWRYWSPTGEASALA
jgi:hypothetical protein